MQTNLNRETIKRNAGSFSEADAFRVVRRREHKARQLAKSARRSLKAAALLAFLIGGGAANAADAERVALPPIPAAMFEQAAVSKAKFCGNMWKGEKVRLVAAGYTWRDYSRQCFAALKDKKAPARTAAKAGAMCTTDSDCEAKTGRPVSLEPAAQ